MKRIPLLITVTLGVVACVVVLTVFLRRDASHQEQAVLHDVFQLQQMEVTSFDPLDAYHAGHIQAVKQIYNTLVDIGSDGKPIPSLSDRWESEDGVTWRFHLRSGVLFHADDCFTTDSARRLVADDVKFTFERLLAKESKSLGISYFSGIQGFDAFRSGDTNALSGITIVGADVVEFRLTSSNRSFPSLLTLPYASIVKSAAVSTYGQDFKLHPVGTGPFILRQYKPESLTFVTNREYWEHSGQPLAFDGIDLKLVADENLAFTLFRNQEVDFIELSYPLLKQAESTSFKFAVSRESQQGPQLNFYLFNLETIQNPEVRRAISYAFDRSALQAILGDYGTAVGSFYPPALFPEISSRRDALSYQPAKAKAGLTGVDTLRLVCFEDVLSRSLAEFTSKTLAPYGVEVSIEAVPFPVLIDRLTKGQYDLIQIYWGPLYADATHYATPFTTPAFPPAGNNFNKYSNPEFDKLIATANSMGHDDRVQVLRQAEKVILSDMPFLLFYYKNTIRLSNGRFSLPLNPLQYRFYKDAKPKDVD